MPFSEFEVELTKLIDRCNLDPAMKVHYLRNKINKRLRDALVHRDPPGESEFVKWLDLCRLVARNLDDADHRNKLASHFYKADTNNNTGGGGGNSGNSDERPVSQGGNQMDLDAVGLAGIIHQEVLDQRQRDGQCRRCGQPGHIARGCINS
ncbi:hypothetical protein N0V85_009909, partial [Neurospora sp. IMI 360204]